MNQPKLDLSPKVSDEIRKTTCYMCACRCGINVHMKDGQVAYIEGNRDHPVNKGVLCAKGSAGIMQVNAPSRLRAPLKRVGPRGSGEFEEISWDEALGIATGWLEPIRKNDPSKLAFFTGRDQSQSFTSFWAQNFGTPNYAAHGGFCSVNMAAAGIYTMGGAFWEFGQPDWDHTKLFMLFGVAEDHDSNPIKMGIGKIKARGARVIGVNNRNLHTFKLDLGTTSRLARILDGRGVACCPGVPKTRLCRRTALRNQATGVPTHLS